MTQALPISKTITTMAQLQERFALEPADTDRFFPEWHEDLPALTAAEQALLDKIKQRFVRHRTRGEIPEGTVNMLIVAHLLEAAGFYDEPFFITNEHSVEVVLEDRDEKLRGRLDTLVFQAQFWSAVVESKKSISLAAGIPQLLAYMMAVPDSDRLLYGMVADGDFYMFIKLAKQKPAIYDFSDVFSLFLVRQNKLYEVFQILKNLRHAIASAV